jgi:hypothetical protein
MQIITAIRKSQLELVFFQDGRGRIQLGAVVKDGRKSSEYSLDGGIGKSTHI